MARRLTEYHGDVPAMVREYSPAIHGRGDEGIRRWKDGALTWLSANPDRTLPCGDGLGVLRTATRLLADEWRIPL